jgi:DNA-binding NarL/FixJ family response regulator/anti-sigma regulatory factor (Ser/Thr protein kinase)
MGWATSENVSGQVRRAGPPAERRPSVPDGKSPPALGDYHHVRTAVAAERARIARQMDDTVSKTLLGVSMVADSLATVPRATDRQALDHQLTELAQLARRAVSDTRSVINDLREEALAGEVRSVATGWGILTGLQVSCQLEAGGTVPADIRREIMAILGEALRNVEQHARASRVRVLLRRAGHRLVLAVEDDGTGQRLPPDLATLRAAGCCGLAGMNERARRLGGRLIVQSRPGRGTRVQVEIPAPAPARQPSPAASVTSQVRAIVADGNPVFRLGLRAALERAPGIRIAAEAANGDDAITLVRTHQPDVLLLDIRMPLPGGAATIAHLSQLTQVVMLTSADDGPLVMEAAAAGASGCLMRGELEQGELIQVVLDAAGQRPVPAHHAPAGAAGPLRANLGRAASGPAACSPMDLRPREREIMGLIADGLSNRQIAARLVITEKTVKNHICSIYQRFGVSERSQAVSLWQQLLPNSDAALGMSP